MSDQGHRPTALRLRPLEIGDEPSACAAHAELDQEGFAFLLDWSPGEPWSGYVERLDRCRRGEDLPPGWVPSTFLVADVGGEVVGRTSIRHELNDYLPSAATSATPYGPRTAAVATHTKSCASRSS